MAESVCALDVAAGGVDSSTHLGPGQEALLIDRSVYCVTDTTASSASTMQLERAYQCLSDLYSSD